MSCPLRPQRPLLGPPPAPAAPQLPLAGHGCLGPEPSVACGTPGCATRRLGLGQRYVTEGTLMSRCSTPLLWQCARPAAMSRIITQRSPSGMRDCTEPRAAMSPAQRQTRAMRGKAGRNRASAGVLAADAARRLPRDVCWLEPTRAGWEQGEVSQAGGGEEKRLARLVLQKTLQGAPCAELHLDAEVPLFLPAPARGRQSAAARRGQDRMRS